jgi:hypothetical protein
MQFLLAWYLWSRLPKSFPATNGNDSPLKSYPSAGQRGFYDSPLGFARVPLPSYEYPNYLFANDVCRTVPVVQLTCIALFLFSILNNIPAIAKNIFIIWKSTRFVSEDEEGITKIHYWRECRASRESANGFLESFYRNAMDKFKFDIEDGNMDEIKAFLCEMFFKGSFLHSYEGPDQNEKEKLPNEEGAISETPEFSDFLREERMKKMISRENEINRKQYFTWEQGQFALAGRRRWMLPKFCIDMLPDNISKKFKMASHNKTVARNCDTSQGIIPRNVFEVCETRSFLAEALRMIDIDHNTKPVGTTDDVKSYPKFGCSDRLRRNECKSDEGVQVQICDQVRFNLVRLDYLRPSMVRPSSFRKVEIQNGLEVLEAEITAIEKQAMAEMDCVHAEMLLAKAEVYFLRANLKRDTAMKAVQRASEDLRKAGSKDEIELRQSLHDKEDIATKKGVRLKAKENEFKQAMAIKRMKQEASMIALDKMKEAAYQRQELFQDKNMDSNQLAYILEGVKALEEDIKIQLSIAKEGHKTAEEMADEAQKVVGECKTKAKSAKANLKEVCHAKEIAEKEFHNTIHIARAEASKLCVKEVKGDIEKAAEGNSITDINANSDVLIEKFEENWRSHYQSWKDKQLSMASNSERIMTDAKLKTNFWEHQLQERKQQCSQTLGPTNIWRQSYEVWRDQPPKTGFDSYSNAKGTSTYWNEKMSEALKENAETPSARYKTLTLACKIAQWQKDEAVKAKEGAKKKLRKTEKAEALAEMKVSAKEKALENVQNIMSNIEALYKPKSSFSQTKIKTPTKSQTESEKPTKHNAIIDLICEKLGRDFSDLKTAKLLSDIPARMLKLRVLATLFGVVPEILTLVMITVTAVPYILWSGFKVDSDTQGMEEIIMATLAVNFIYEIDDAVYDHILPELYKEAHERDKYEIARYWTSSNTTSIFEETVHDITNTVEKRGKQKESHAAIEVEKIKDLNRLMRCAPLVCEVLKPVYVPLMSQPSPNVTGVPGPSPAPALLQLKGSDPPFQCEATVIMDQGQYGSGTQLSHHDFQQRQDHHVCNDQGVTEDVTVKPVKNSAILADLLDYEKKKFELDKLMKEFDEEMEPLTASVALQTSTTDHWNDLYLARAYPFLYSRKLTYILNSHWWERFLIAYGKYGAHYIVLSLVSVAIVGGYRSLAQCDRFSDSSSVFGQQPWPGTCLLNVGPRASNFSLLNGSTADEFMPVSCGISGYVPNGEEWSNNNDYFTKP